MTSVARSLRINERPSTTSNQPSFCPGPSAVNPRSGRRRSGNLAEDSAGEWYADQYSTQLLWQDRCDGRCRSDLAKEAASSIDLHTILLRCLPRDSRFAGALISGLLLMVLDRTRADSTSWKGVRLFSDYGPRMS